MITDEFKFTFYKLNGCIAVTYERKNKTSFFHLARNASNFRKLQYSKTHLHYYVHILVSWTEKNGKQQHEMLKQKYLMQTLQYRNIANYSLYNWHFYMMFIYMVNSVFNGNMHHQNHFEQQTRHWSCISHTNKLCNKHLWISTGF